MRKFLYIDSGALPDYFLKVLEAKQMLESGRVKSVTDVAELLGISRSTYYKYKDSVFDGQKNEIERHATYMLILSHETGVLSNVLGLFSSMNMSIITISQSPPVAGSASVMLTVDMAKSIESADEILERAKEIGGLKQIQLLAIS